MPESIDELYNRWQESPDSDRTIALCDALRGSRRTDIADVVGGYAARQLDVRLLTAAAHMFSDMGRFADAQPLLVSAGRIAPRDGSVYQALGEVLVRRGDVERAAKVLERAIELDGSHPRTKAWLERARALVPMQRSSGMIAVAEEVARVGQANAGGRAPVEDDIQTLVRNNDDVKSALRGARRPFMNAPAAGRPAEPASAGAYGAPSSGQPSSAGLGENFLSAFATMPLSTIGAEPIDDALASALSPAHAPTPHAQRDARRAQPSNGLHASHPPPSSRSGMALGFAQTEDAPLPAPSSQAPLAPASAQDPASNPFLVGRAPPPAPSAPSSMQQRAMPEARDVLHALQIAGVFEPDGAVKPQNWDKPDKRPRRVGSVIALVLLASLLVGGGTGTFYFVKDKRAKQHVEAESILAQVDLDLRAADRDTLEASERAIARAFDLESRSPHAALTWLRERAIVGLLKGGENVAFEDGSARARDVGVPEKQIAFASVASFLFQNDIAGAASTLAKWDGKADDDAFYQLLAGATLERAGDARALERYAAAAKLDPNLYIADVLLARATAVDGDPHQAAELAQKLKMKAPTRAEGQALVALAWARDPMRGDPPPEAKEIAERAETLHGPLRAVGHAVRALLAIERHDLEVAKAALRAGLPAAETPGLASWLGNIALSTGDEALARKGALAAVSYSAMYPPARMLAARVALLGARLDEALKAAEELDATSPDVAIVTSAVAYEKLDGERMSRALEALSADTKRMPLIDPLVRGQAVLVGAARAIDTKKAVDMAEHDTPWADLVAMDAMLDAGELDAARTIAAAWRKASPLSETPLRAVRLARLARWEGKLDEASRLSAIALERANVTPRAAIERAFVLVAVGKPAEALALFKAYPNLGGAVTRWLRAYALASSGKIDEARAIVSQEDPPPALAPLPVRMLAASAYGAVKDARHGKEYVEALARSGFTNPDVSAAAERVGASGAAARASRRR